MSDRKYPPSVVRVPYDDETPPEGVRFVEVELEAVVNATVRNTVVMAIPDTIEDDDIEDYLSEHAETLVMMDNGLPRKVQLTYAMADLLHPGVNDIEVDIDSMESVTVNDVRLADAGDRVTLIIPAEAEARCNELVSALERIAELDAQLAQVVEVTGYGK